MMMMIKISMMLLLLMMMMMQCIHGQQTTPAGLYGADVVLTSPNDDAVLQCTINTESYVVTWTKDGRQIQNSNKYTLSDANHTLTVNNAGEMDVGLYMCSLGPNTAPYPINLFAQPVTTPLLSTSVTEGDTLSLKCHAWGWPIPTLLWTANDRVIGIPQPGVSFGDGVLGSNNSILQNSILYMENMHRSDQMNYTCTAYNQFGSPIRTYTSVATVYVRVKDRLAALWPFLGILIETILIVIFIIIFEGKRRAKLNAEKSN